MPSQSKNVSADVFLNIPYDNDELSELLLIAFTAALVALGRKPHLTFELPDGGAGRMRRIFSLLRSCPVSFHDLSAVSLPVRFNMPFELGLTLTWARLNPGQHSWFVFESRERRVQKSLSDLNGTDPNIHDGTVEGVMRELCNAFVRARAARPEVPEMMRT